MHASSTERSRSKRCRTPAPSRSLCATCADPLLRVTSRIPRLASALRPSATSGCRARSAKPPSTCWTASSRSRSRFWPSSCKRSISPPSRANGFATPDTVRANPSRSNSANQVCARCAGAPTSSNLAASGDMSDSVSLTSKTSSAGSRGLGSRGDRVVLYFVLLLSGGAGGRAVARWRGRIFHLASGSTGTGRRSRPGSSGEEVHRGERQHDLVVLVEGLDGGAHESPVRFGARGTRLGDRDADAQLVAGSHGSRPAELVEAGRGQAGYPGDVVVDVEPHARGDRVDTARDQPVERARRRPSRVGVDRLGVVVPGEGDDLRLAQARVTELVNRPRHVVLEPSVADRRRQVDLPEQLGHDRACSPASVVCLLYTS